MRTVRLIIKIVRIAASLYGMAAAVSKSRWLIAGLSILFSMVRRRSVPTRPVAAVQFVNATDPAIYRRVGWRRIVKDKVD